jgi:O-antigen/teichoic acid export membrane protein
LPTKASRRCYRGALFAGLVMLLLHSGKHAHQAALTMLAGSHAVAALFMMMSLQWRLRCVGVRFGRVLMKGWLSEAGPLGMADVLRRLTYQLDTLLLGLLQAPAVVGIYSVACRPLATLNWMPQVMLAATLPSFARMAGGDRAGLQRAFATSIRLLWIVSLPITVSICVCAEPVVMVLAGQEYLEAAVPLRILIWITSLLFLSVPVRFFLAALGEARIYARLVLVVLVFEAVSEAALIPWWGYFGACAGSVVGELIFTGRGLAICRRFGMGMIEWGAMGRAALAGGGMGAALWLVRDLPLPLLALAILLVTGLYFLACLCLQALRWDEIATLVHRKAALPTPLLARVTSTHAVASDVPLNGSVLQDPRMADEGEKEGDGRLARSL